MDTADAKTPRAYSKLNSALVVLTLIGVIDTLYLTKVHFEQSSAFCAIIQGCDVVLQSAYSTVYGVPLALIGLVYYAALFALLTAWISRRGELYLKGILVLSGLGLIASLWLVYLQIFVLTALCQYCLVSAFLTLSIFVLSYIERKRSTYVVPEII